VSRKGTFVKLALAIKMLFLQELCALMELALLG